MENSFTPKPSPINADPHPPGNHGIPVSVGEPPSLPIHPVETPITPPVTTAPDYASTPENPVNPATAATEAFKKKEQHGFLRSLGHVIRTAGGEFFTWFGAPLIPAGIALAYKAITNPELMKNVTKAVMQDPTIKERITNLVGADMLTSTLDKLQPMIESAPIWIPGIGIAVSALGLLSTRIGSIIGWKSAKHGGENIQKLYQIGKIAELGAATIAVFNPALAFLYPIAKGFSIAATFIAHTKRP